MHAQAELGDREGRLALSAIQLVAGAASAPGLQARGMIGDVLAFTDVQVTGDLDIPTSNLLALAGLQGDAEIGQVQGRFRLSDADGSTGIELLDAQIRNTGLMSLRANGEIDDLANLDQIRLQANLETPSTAKLAEALGTSGISLERFQFDGKLLKEGRQLDADGQTILSETRFDGTVRGDFGGARPSFEAKLHSPRVRLADLGVLPAASTDAVPPDQATVATSRDLFGRAPLPLDLRPLRFEVAGGHVPVDAAVDSSAPTPTWHIKAVSDDIQLGDVWQQLETAVPLSGELDLLPDVQASGSSPHDLASSLSGELSVALQRGQIRSRCSTLPR